VRGSRVLGVVLVALAIALSAPAMARASIGSDGSTRAGAPPVVPLMVGAPQRLRMPALHQGTFAYGTDPAQRLDAYWPDARHGGRQPGLLLLHGGYWFGGDKTNWRGIARRLAARGYAVFSANYRLSTAAPWPAQRDDTAAALTYIQRHARRFQLDPERMVVVGSSAGGQLATVLGATGPKGVRGVVALSPVNSPYLAYVDGGRPAATGPQRKLSRAVTQLVRCRPTGLAAAMCLDRMQQAAPQVTAAAVPMLLVHSQGDFVPVGHSTLVRDALAGAGGRADVKLVPGSAHGGNLLRLRRVYATVVAWIDAVTRGHD
jgi:acetyl esterase/lipase